MHIVTFDNVTRAFGKTWALNGVTLEIEEGAAVGLIGRNGAGKTTLLRLIPPLLHATSGEVRVLGMEPWTHQDEVRAELGYLSNADPFPPKLRIRDLFDLCRAARPKWDQAWADRLRDAMRLSDKSELGALSTGQQRQVGMIAAVCHRPKLLVLDEPAGGFDPIVRREMLGLVAELIAQSESTLILSSHQFADIERLADHVALLHEGRLLGYRPLASLRDEAFRVRVAVPGFDAGLLRDTPELVALRPGADGVDATFFRGEAVVRERLAALGVPAERIDVARLTLEELFIDWAA
jgi:ABC-2 type transport system ATP-binding protein